MDIPSYVAFIISVPELWYNNTSLSSTMFVPLHFFSSEHNIIRKPVMVMQRPFCTFINFGSESVPGRPVGLFVSVRTEKELWPRSYDPGWSTSNCCAIFVLATRIYYTLL